MARLRTDWNEIREAYETDPSPLTVIAVRFAVSKRHMHQVAVDRGWIRCAGAYRGSARPGAGRHRSHTSPELLLLVQSLRRTTGLLVRQVEQRLGGEAGAAAEVAEVDEKDVRTLGALAAMLAKVIALDREPRSFRDDQSQTGPEPRSRGSTAGRGRDDPVDFDDPRQRDAFSLRLERLAAERAAAADAGDDAG